MTGALSAKEVARDYYTRVWEAEPVKAVELLSTACKCMDDADCESVDAAFAMLSLSESVLFAVKGGLAGLVVMPDANEFETIQAIVDSGAAMHAKALAYLGSRNSPIRHKPEELFSLVNETGTGRDG